MRNEQFIILYRGRFGSYSQCKRMRFESAYLAKTHIETATDSLMNNSLIYVGVPAVEVDNDGVPIIKNGQVIPRS